MTQNEPLLSVLYSSTASRPMSDDALRDLLAQSRAANSGADLTGMLLYRAGRFLQVLEGPAGRVRALLGTIAADDRHGDMRILVEEPIAERSFAEWTMGYEPISVPEEPTPEGFRETFDDLDRSDDPRTVMRALRELTIWFRVRSSRPAVA